MKKILLLILNGSESLECSPFIDVFGWNNILNKNKIQVDTCGFDSYIKLAWNISIIPEINLNSQNISINDYDALVIPGGFGFAGFFSNINNKNLSDLILEFNKQNKIIIGICTSAILLGEIGILNNKKATTYYLENERYFKQLKQYGAIPLKKEIVIDKNIITSSGPKTAIDVAFILLSMLTSVENSNYVKENMFFQ